MSTMEMPLISVIVPAYNAERWLYECGQSVLGQSYERVQLVIVDDGSTDRTLDIANELAKDSDAVKVIHTENGGVCRARNIGLDAADGELVAFLDADDLLLPEALARMYRLLADHTCDIVSASFMTIDENTVMADIAIPKNEDMGVRMWDETQALEKSLQDDPATYAVWGKLYRKRFLDGVRFMPGKRIHEDSFFLFECFLKQPCMLVCDAVVLCYRTTESGASRAPFSEKFFDILYFAERKMSLVAEHYSQYTSLAKNVWVKANMALLQNLCKSDGRRYRREEKDCIRAVIENKKYFIPATAFHRRWFMVITHHLYLPYKWLWKLKQRI